MGIVRFLGDTEVNELRYIVVAKKLNKRKAMSVICWETIPTLLNSYILQM